MNITQRLQIHENITRSIDKDGTLIKHKITEIGNLSKEFQQDMKEYQNLTDRRLDDLENKTRVYNVVTDRRLDDLENKTRVYDALISNLTVGSYNAGKLSV